MNIKIVEDWNDLVPMLSNRANHCMYISKWSSSRISLLNYTETINYINASREDNGCDSLNLLTDRDDSFKMLQKHFDELEIRGILTVIHTEDKIIYIKEFYEDLCGDYLDEVLKIMMKLSYSSNNLTCNPHNVDEITNTSSSTCNILTKPPFIK